MTIPVPQRIKITFLLCGVILVAESASLLLTRHDAATGWLLDFLFQALVRALVAAVCLWQARRAVSLRLHWILWAGIFLPGAIALSLRAWMAYDQALSHHVIDGVLDFTDVILDIGIVAVIMLFTVPSGRPYPKTFFLVDAVQAGLLICVFHMQLFDVLPFAHAHTHPASGTTLVMFNAAVGVVATAWFFLRFWGAATTDERRFFATLALSYGAAKLLLTIHDVVAGDARLASFYDLLGTLPLLVMLVLIAGLPNETREGARATPPRRLAHILNTASPLTLTLMLMAMGIDASRRDFSFGLGVTAAAVVLHTLRYTITQRELERSERALKRARGELETLARTDPLTGLANRRAFEEKLTAEWQRATRARAPLSLLIMDVDYFKRLNDRDGHQAGDECLSRVAAARSGSLQRSGDFLVRYGGEEFCAILPATDADGARATANRMRAAVADLFIPNETPIGLYATVSIGAATCAFPTAITPHQLLEQADQALYRAKQNGRNRVESAPSPDPVPVGSLPADPVGEATGVVEALT